LGLADSLALFFWLVFHFISRFSFYFFSWGFPVYSANKKCCII